MTNKKILLVALSGIMTVIIITACSSKFSGYKQTDSGIYYKFYVNEDSESPAVGDVLTLGMSYKAEDSLLFNSYENTRPFQLLMQGPQYRGDIYECISMLSVGDSASFIIKADSFFYVTAGAPSLPSYLDSTSYMYFNIMLKKFQTQEEAQLEREAELKELQEKEGGIIQDYIEKNNITTLPDEEGLYFIELKKGTGQKVDSGKIVMMNYTLMITSGDTLFSTLNQGELIDFEYGTRFDTKGFNKGIGQMRKGGKAMMIVPSSLAFGANGAGESVGPYTPLVYEIEVVDIRNKAEYEKEKAAKQEMESKALAEKEQADIKKYLNENNFDAKPSESGLYYIETKAGEGDIPISGDNVKVHYTLTTLANDTIDSSFSRNEPLEFTIDQPGIIDGWHEAIKYMRVGGKALWLVPSKLAYGPEGRPPMIPPYTPLLFNVEFVEIVK